MPFFKVCHKILEDLVCGEIMNVQLTPLALTQYDCDQACDFQASYPKSMVSRCEGYDKIKDESAL